MKFVIHVAVARFYSLGSQKFPQGLQWRFWISYEPIFFDHKLLINISSPDHVTEHALIT